MRVQYPARVESLVRKREHWAEKNRRAQKQRSEAHSMLLTKGRAPEHARYLLTFTRIAPPQAGRLDPDDNLPRAFKHILDGACDWLGIDDGDQRVKAVYRQEVGDWGCRIEIEERTRCHECGHELEE